MACVRAFACVHARARMRSCVLVVVVVVVWVWVFVSVSHHVCVCACMPFSLAAGCAGLHGGAGPCALRIRRNRCVRRGNGAPLPVPGRFGVRPPVSRCPGLQTPPWPLHPSSQSSFRVLDLFPAIFRVLDLFLGPGPA